MLWKSVLRSEQLFMAYCQVKRRMTYQCIQLNPIFVKYAKIYLWGGKKKKHEWVTVECSLWLSSAPSIFDALTHWMLTAAHEAGTVNIFVVPSRKWGAEWLPKSPGTTQLGSAGVDLPDKSGYIHTVESWEEILQDAEGGYIWDDALFDFLLGSIIFWRCSLTST